MEEFREYKNIIISEIIVKCDFCRGTVFKQGKAQLNTKQLTLLNLDWLNVSSLILICTRCGAIKWFLKSKYELVMDENIKFKKEEFVSEIKEAIECLNCGNLINPNENSCSKCGWTYR